MKAGADGCLLEPLTTSTCAVELSPRPPVAVAVSAACEVRPPKLIVGPNCCYGDNSLPRSTSSHRRPAWSTLPAVPTTAAAPPKVTPPTCSEPPYVGRVRVTLKWWTRLVTVRTALCLFRGRLSWSGQYGGASRPDAKLPCSASGDNDRESIRGTQRTGPGMLPSKPGLPWARSFESPAGRSKHPARAGGRT